MEPLERVRVGIIGCGRIATLQVLGHLDHARARVAAVCDVALAERRRAEWGAARAYADYRELLADPGVDAVEIVLPHVLHREVAVAALAAGKHVSLQKPPTLTLADLAEVDAAARAAGRRMRVFENFKYYPPHVRARELVRAGAIGDPLSVRIKTAAGRFEDGWDVPMAAQAWRMDPERCGGGPTCFDHGYHCFNMGRFFIDEPALVLYRDGETRAFHDLAHDWAESFRLGAHDFIDALLEGRQPAQDAAQAAETLRFALAAHLSAREHREVALAEVGPETRAVLPD